MTPLDLARGVVADGVRGAAEAMFPANDLGAPDWRDAEIVRRVLDYLAELPPHSQALLVALYSFVELGGPALAAESGRFSQLPAPRRREIIRNWRRSRVTVLKMLGDGLKASLTMSYLSHPTVLEHIGLYKHCDNPDDAMRVPLRPSPFERPPAGGASR